MLQTTKTSILHHAPVETFELMCGKILSGDRLRDIRLLQSSVARFGLLSPVVAIERKGRLIVVDGRKRLAAIRRLAFEGRLSASLARIPYILVNDIQDQGRRVPVLIANRDLFEAVCRQFRADPDVRFVAAAFQISGQCVRDILSLARLAPSVRNAFFERQIDFSQARAFASQPDNDAQHQALSHLGTASTPEEILAFRADMSEQEAVDLAA